jgi:Tfp pilus assembly protein PilP
MLKWLIAALSMMPQLAFAQSRALEMQLTQVLAPDVVHLVADMSAQDVILVRPANEQRIDIPRQRISPLALRQQMLNRLDSKAAEHGGIEIIVPSCQKARFVPVNVPKNDTITINFVRVSAGVALALALEDAGLRTGEVWKTPDVDLMVRVANVRLADLITALAAAVDVDVVISGSDAQLRPRNSNPACVAGIYEHIDSTTVPKRAKNEYRETRFSMTACGRLAKFPQSKDTKCEWYEDQPLSRFKLRGFIALSDRAIVMAVVEPPLSPLNRHVVGSRLSEDFVAFTEVTRESAQLARFEYRNGKLEAVEGFRAAMNSSAWTADPDLPLPGQLPRPVLMTEYYPLEELMVADVYVRDGAKEALVRDVNGRATRVRLGFTVGMRSGKVIGIDDAGITLMEIVPNHLGGYIEQQARMVRGEWYESPRAALVRRFAAPVNDTAQQREFITAARAGETEKLGGLLARGAVIDARLEDGDENALMAAAGHDRLSTLRWLLARGAKPNLLIGERDDSALKIAAMMKYIGAARALLDGGADINVADAKLRSPLYMAANIGATGMVEFLLGRGADPRQQSENGMTSFTAAAASGCVECVKWMLAAGVKSSEKDRNGYTMLTMAQEMQKSRLVEFLRSRGAEPGAAASK